MSGTTTISSSETKAEALKLQSSAYGATVPIVHGTARIAGNMIDYGDFRAIAWTQVQEQGGKGGGGVRTENTTYTYTATVMMGLCEGPITDVGQKWRGKEKFPAGEFAAAGSAGTARGLIGQPHWTPLEALAGGTHLLSYSGLAYFAIQDYDLGSTAQVDNHNFEVIGPGANEVHSSIPDALPSSILIDWISHDRRGRGLPSTMVGDMSEYANYCKAAGLFLSPALTEQQSAADRIKLLGELTNADVVVSDRKIHMVPLASESVSKAIAGGPTFSYTPDLTPLFDLTPDQFLSQDGEAPVKVIRKTPADVYNVVKVQFRNRGNDYATDVAVAEDRANIDIYGKKEAPIINADWVCEHGIAQTIARMRLQRYLTTLREYRFSLPWNFAEILPTNLLRLTEPSQGLDAVPVRVTRFTESELGWDFVAEDFPAASTAAPLYSLPVQDGFVHGYSDNPGATTVAAVFEAPFDASTTGLEVWAAVHGGPAWGGAHMWVSLDGVAYRRVGTVWGGTRSGQLSGAVSGGVLPVSGMTGKLLDASAADASARVSLCYVGGASPEYLAYQTASLTGAGAYQLGGLVRGLYGTSDSSAHASGDVFVRCDDALAKSGALDIGMVGRQLHIKFQSFNLFGLQAQDLADVDATLYTVTGRYAQPIDEPGNLVKQGVFSQLPLGQTPDTWDGGQVVSITGQAFSRALQVSAATPASLSRFSCEAGRKLYVSFTAKVLHDNANFQAGVRFYSAAGVDLGFYPAGSVRYKIADPSQPGPVPIGQEPTWIIVGWATRSNVFTAPADAAYGVPELVYDTSVSVGPAQLGRFVVKLQAITADMELGAATDVYSVNATSVIVNNVITVQGMPNTVTEVIINPPFQCRVLVTFTSTAKYTNSSVNVGFGSIAVYHRSGSYDVFAGQEKSIGTEGGVGTKAAGDLTSATSFFFDPALWTGQQKIQVRAGKLRSGDTFEISNAQMRVELVKL